jgi:hypothetical protein
MLAIMICLGGENSTLRIWSIQSGRLLQTISGLPGVVTGFGSPSESGGYRQTSKHQESSMML